MLDQYVFAYKHVLQRFRYNYFMTERHGELSLEGRRLAAGIPKGCIIVSIHHYGMWVLGRWVKERGGFIIRHDSRLSEAAHAGGKHWFREKWQAYTAYRILVRYGAVSIFTGADMLKAVRLLREGHDVIIMQDIFNPDRNASTTFLGEAVQWPIGVVRLAALSGRPIVFAKAEWGRGGWRISSTDPLANDETTIKRKVEDAVRSAPWDWALMLGHIKSVSQLLPRER